MGKKGHQKFIDVWANQTNLGKQFGLSSVAMGKKLKELKLRGEDGNPTAQALCQGYCTPTRIPPRRLSARAIAHRRRSRMAPRSLCGTGSRSRN